MREPADKPGSVEGNHSSGTRVAADLKRPTRRRAQTGAAPSHRGLCWALPPYLALLQVGFAVPSLLPRPRCAITAPFHPYRPVTGLGGLLSVALSVGSRPPGVTWHPVCRSPDFPPPRTQHARSSDCLADSRLSPYTLLDAKVFCSCKGVAGAKVFAPAALFTARRLHQSVSLIARDATELCGQRGDAPRGQLIEQQ